MSTTTYPEPTLPTPLRRIITIAAVLTAVIATLVAVVVEREPGPATVTTERPAAAVDAESQRLESLADYWASRSATAGVPATAAGSDTDRALAAETERLRQLAEHWQTRNGSSATDASSERALAAETERLRQLAEHWQTRLGGDAVTGSAADRAELARILQLAETARAEG